MFVQSLYLKNFRNFEQASVYFSPKVNLIYGDNAQGKTNLIEALYFLSTGRSFRTHHISEMIRQGEKGFYLETYFIKEGIEQRLSISFDGDTRKIQYNNTSYPSFTSLLGILPTVLYAPSDISLISGMPAERRRFFDLHLAQIDPLYVYHLMRYHKAVKQRNCLLRQRKEALLHPWEHIMSHSGHYLSQRRMTTLKNFPTILSQAMHDLSDNKECLELSYEASFEISSGTAGILKQIEKHRSKELQIGQSLIGPHKDDLLLTLDGKKAKVFSSEGQKRCSIAAIKMTEWHHLQHNINEAPLLIIDDFNIHLDAERTKRLGGKLQTFGQVFLTSPSSMFLQEEQNLLYVKEGNVIPHSRA